MYKCFKYRLSVTSRMTPLLRKTNKEREPLLISTELWKRERQWKSINVGSTLLNK